MSLKIIDKNIRTIVTNAAKLNMLIHETAVLVMVHASEHGDCTRAMPLLNAMPASMRRTMLQLWFETYSPIRFQMQDGKATKVGMLKPNAKKFTAFDVDAAKATPFFDLAEANPEGKVFDFDRIVALVASMAKRIEKKLESGEIPEADIPSATAAAHAIAGLKLVRVNGKPVDQSNEVAPLGGDVEPMLKAVA